MQIGPGFKDIKSFQSVESGLQPDIWSVDLNISERHGREQRYLLYLSNCQYNVELAIPSITQTHAFKG